MGFFASRLLPKGAFVALAGLAAVAAAAPDARAYCRSTTCSGDCPRDDDGCKTTGKPLAWSGLCVGFSLQEDASANLPMERARPAIVASMITWSEVECDGGGLSTIAFSRLDDAACRRPDYVEGGPNANVILFQDNRWTYKGAGNSIAKTTVTFDTDTGEILDADIELNHAYNELTVGDDRVVYDLQSIVTHEIGHAIGLDHTPDVEATMNALYDPGMTEPRDLAFDDLAATCAVYPPGRAARCEPEPRGGLAYACSGEQATEEQAGCSASGRPASPRPGAPFAAALALASIVAARRTLRQRPLPSPRMS
jgi:hypothetical protein